MLKRRLLDLSHRVLLMLLFRVHAHIDLVWDGRRKRRDQAVKLLFGSFFLSSLGLLLRNLYKMMTSLSKCLRFVTSYHLTCFALLLSLTKLHSYALEAMSCSCSPLGTSSHPSRRNRLLRFNRRHRWAWVVLTFAAIQQQALTPPSCTCGFQT